MKTIITIRNVPRGGSIDMEIDHEQYITDEFVRMHAFCDVAQALRTFLPSKKQVKEAKKK